MRSSQFEGLIRVLKDLSAEQKRRLQEVLEQGDPEASVLALLESRLGSSPNCHHCGADFKRVQRWGRSHGLQRWRCRNCQRSFNALSGTPLARLRKRMHWLAFAQTLSERLTVAQAAERCGVHPTTSFRWRHRFLRAQMANQDPLGGIVEADETFFRLSFKGAKRWCRPKELAGGGWPIGRGTVWNSVYLICPMRVSDRLTH